MQRNTLLTTNMLDREKNQTHENRKDSQQKGNSSIILRKSILLYFVLQLIFYQ